MLYRCHPDYSIHGELLGLVVVRSSACRVVGVDFLIGLWPGLLRAVETLVNHRVILATRFFRFLCPQILNIICVADNKGKTSSLLIQH